MDATLSDPVVGRLLDGRYRVEARIASGGMASVYLATDTRLERRVAVKVMHPHLADDPETALRFEREARSAARLSHPNVVAVYDQGADAGHAFLVMEYVPGTNLREVIRARGRLAPGEAIAVMDRVLAALAAAHEAGLVHRDVKPENVLLTADGRVKVADFGLARAVAGSTLTTTAGVLLGTAAYIAPETVSGHGVDARSDVYAAGVMLFELLTGSTPFGGDSAWAVLHRHVAEDVPPPSSRADGVPAQIDELVMLATARDPQRRPATAGALHARLVAVRDRLGLHDRVPALPTAVTARLGPPTQPPATTRVVPPPGGPPPPPSIGAAPPAPPRRRRRGWLLATVLAVTVALAVTAGWWLAVGRFADAPNVLGLDKVAAAKQLDAAGLHAKWLSAVPSSRYHAGTVAAESPAADHRVSRGGTVSLRLSSGPVHHDIPSFAGSSVAAATANLEKLHYVVGSPAHAYSDTVTKGLVVRTKPKAGTSLPEGATVRLVVSKGVAPVPIPSVVHLSGDAATKLLSDKDGFAVTPRQRYSDSVPAGDAIGTNPPAGTKADKGSSVTLYISKGPHLYPVPNVDGQPLADAIRAMRGAGFTPDPKELFPGGPGEVIRHTPSGDQPRGTTIELDYY